MLKRGRKYHKGKAIIFALAAINIIMATILLIMTMNFTVWSMQAVISATLFMSTVWARWLFVCGAVFTAGLAAMSLWAADFSSGVFPMAVILPAVYLIFQIIGIILLFAGKSVTEYLYLRSEH